MGKKSKDHSHMHIPSSAAEKTEPFCRKRLRSGHAEDVRFRCELLTVLSHLNDETAAIQESIRSEEESQPMQPSTINDACLVLSQHWKLKDRDSEIAFKGLVLVLEHCLSFELKNHSAFQNFVENLGYHTVFFWKKAVPLIYDSDMQHGTNCRDALLFSLALYDVNTGKNRLRELFAAVPGLRDSLLGQSAKRFHEAFKNMLQRRVNNCSGSSSVVGSSRASDADPSEFSRTALDDAFDEEDESSVSNESSSKDSIGDANTEKSASASLDEGFATGTVSDASVPEVVLTSCGLTMSHFSERVINVSNAPPVSLKKRNDSWEVGQGSGGLVSCCAPVLAQDPSNMWLACFGPDVPFGAATIKSTLASSPTNALGLPRSSTPVQRQDSVDQKVIADEKSLLNVLKNYGKDNYKLNPVVVNQDDYETYYGGISNGLLWPALHNLPEYIIKDYKDLHVLKEHWNAYIRVNYMFAINAVRNSRPQDFLWIHDYHLMLTGSVIQSLDTHLEIGFFLHIPFQPPEEFFTKYSDIGHAVLRGILKFTKVGFQTHRDRATFIQLAQRHLNGVKVRENRSKDTIVVTYEGFSASIGVFPVSIKNEEFLDLASNTEIIELSKEIRQKLLGNRGGKLYFSVERFDYTKGIKEKLRAYQRYYELYPERIGKDVFLQVAVINRRSVETYKQYQDECILIAKEINTKFPCPEDPEWKPLIFQTEGLARPELVAHYLAMDVGIVTPKKDGMNLVAKEMIICHPTAGLLLSDGAGTEQQLNAAGFYSDTKKLYNRIVDLYDVDKFAHTFYLAAIEDREVTAEHGRQLNEFLLANDIEKWSHAFLDPSWTHEVIQFSPLATLDDFFGLMLQTRNLRRKMVERILKGIPVRSHFVVSVRNAKESLEAALQPKTKTLCLKASPSALRATVVLDVADEIKELDIDLAFLKYVLSDDPESMDTFIAELAQFHPQTSDQFQDELDEIITMLSKGDHFNYFFTDRDGTLKSYSCSYAAAVQPCYSGVIQALFAHRCTQYSAILTSAPLLNTGILDVTVMPESYYSYGASNGREWYIDSSRKFKDHTISEDELELLDMLQGNIQELLAKLEFNQFGWIGSGLQRHYGMITIAKQDCTGSIDQMESTNWSQKITELVEKYDPLGHRLFVYHTETDIKICLKTKATEEQSELKSPFGGQIFSKGEGVQLFADEMGLDLSEGNILICGDSQSDLPMLSKALSANPARTFSVWVTCDEQLKQQVSGLCERANNQNYRFVACPEVIVGAMAQSTIREIKIKPSTDAYLSVDYSSEY